MNWFITTKVVQSHIHNLSNPVLVNLVHRVSADPSLSQNVLFSLVQVPETNVNEAGVGQGFVDEWSEFRETCETSEEGQRASMEVS